MKISDECLECILLQAQRVGDILDLNNKQKADILEIATLHARKFDKSLPPPQNAYNFYENISRYLKQDDIYKNIKKISSQQAKEFLPFCKALMKKSEDKLLCAAKIAVVGNVIDLASQIQYDLSDEILKIINTDFAINDFNEFEKLLHVSKNIVYLADNAGEEIFDRVFIETIKKKYKDINFYYFVRGKPIINDLTYLDALNSNMQEVTTLVDSKVPTPGFALEFASNEALSLFNSADIVIAKGMGNYECLSEYKITNLFYLMKIKCLPVAKSLNAKLGSIIYKRA